MSAENLKWRVNMAVRHSNLPSTARLIMFVLSDMADVKTGVIPESKKLPLRVLAKQTGLGESTVKMQLALLEQLGWVVRSRPSAGEQARHTATDYRIQVGLPGEERAPHKRKSGARSKPPVSETEGQEQAPAGGQEMAPESESGGQEQAVRGPGDSSSGARSKPPYIKDDDHYDLDDLKTAAGAAAPGGEDGLFDPPPVPPKRETDKQRAYRIAAGYTQRVRLSNKDAVAGVIYKALIEVGDAGQPLYAEDQIIAALEKLIATRRTVSTGTLNFALNEAPQGVPSQRGNHQTYRDATPSTFRPPK